MSRSATNNSILFLTPAIIWGSTWYVIKFQLGTVDPLVSVGYRFLLAAALFLGFCLLTKRSLKFTLNQHLRIAMQGLFLFGLNYWMTYSSEEYLTSGLVAVGFSTLIFFNIFFGAIFLKTKVDRRVLFAALFGLSGTIIIFRPELAVFNFEDDSFKGLIYCTLGVSIASLGNITSSHNSKLNIPVIQASALGMLYGGVFMTGLAVILGRPFTMDWGFDYVASMIYLVIFGSIVAFATYLTLIKKIGPDKAAYAIVIVPVIAILISSILEGYNFTLETGFGMALLLLGNFLALFKRKRKA